MRRFYESTLAATGLPDGAVGVDAGLTLTKVVRARGGAIDAFAVETSAAPSGDLLTDMRADAPIGVTGARATIFAKAAPRIESEEIEAAVCGAVALLAGDGRAPEGDFVLALLGTGTAFAAVRGGNVSHLGGTALGGGSFAGIAWRIDPSLTYEAMIAGASRGDRTRVDTMVSDAYPDGIGRIGGEMTAAHLAKRGDASIADVLAALLNLHGENIAQIGASRALISRIPRLVLCGGFAHENPRFVESIAQMAGLFGVRVDLAPSPGFAGALGAAIIAADLTSPRRDYVPGPSP
jgi:activator of 2-hydroxyglutaryl-CoA dehydratase